MRWSLLACALFAGGCDCTGTEGEPCASSTDCDDGQICRDGMCVTMPDVPDAGRMDGGPDAGVRPCTADEDCNGGVCLEGACCASARNVCGTSCCTGSETCFANACVVPGAACRTSEDCGEEEYCEPGLGEQTADAGVSPDAGPPSCLGAAPAAGRCVALPPRCEGTPRPGESCRTDCEYRPTAGRLNAVVQWHWGAGTVREYPGRLDVWSTPAVGRVTDTNCDGVVDELDPPNIVFVSGNVQGVCCSCGTNDNCQNGVLRMLDGRTGREVWTVGSNSTPSQLFSGVSTAIGDVDHDGDMEIFAVSGTGDILMYDHEGNRVAVSNAPIIPAWADSNGNGWGGGLALADADHDGDVEIAYGRVVFTTDGTTITRLWEGMGDWGSGVNEAISVFVNLDNDPELELLSGRTAFNIDGSVLWNRTDVPAGFSAAANFDDDPEPEVVHIANHRIYLFSGATGVDEVTSIDGAGTGNGGPPTIADFDGDGSPEIGVAYQNFYEVIEPNYAMNTLQRLWATPNHDLSSSVTGSTVFDFEGDGAAEVIYNDECFLWVYDGTTGAVRFATQTTSFTATEASLVADVDADGSAEIVMISNGIDPSSPAGWDCILDPWTRDALPTEPDFGRPAWVGSDGANAPYRGITVFRASDESWVGTRSLWNQHAYSVSNVCGDRGDPCVPAGTYGDIPMSQVANWTVGFLNNFRQNVQGEGIFDAPDATVTLDAICEDPVPLRASVRNLGAALLPAGVVVGFYVIEGATERELGRAMTTTALFPGQVQTLQLIAPADVPSIGSTFRARILVDPAMPTFRECRDDNNTSPDVEPRCLM